MLLSSPRLEIRVFTCGLEHLGNRLLCQNLLERLLGLTKVDRQRPLNVPANQTIGIGCAMVHREQMSFVDGPVDFEQRDHRRIT